MKLITPFVGEDLLELAKRCNALYICPRVGSKRMGPLVAYAGKDGQGRNLVGDIYFNFRRIEVHPVAVQAFAEAVYDKLCKQKFLNTFDTVCGIPQGGRTFGQIFALIAGKKFIYPDKKPKSTEPGKKQEYTWDLSQFDLEPGERVAVAEDVFNNFQNTDSTLSQIVVTGAKVSLLIGAFNRSPIYDAIYTPSTGAFAGQRIPVVAGIRKSFPEYTQDDPEVIEDIRMGNLELNVKDHWAELCSIMEQYSSQP